MTAPYNHVFRLAGIKSGPVNETPIYDTGLERASAFEIGAASEVDAVAIRHRDGISYVAVGCPVIGPFRGPFQFLTFAGVFAASDDGTSLYDSGGGLRRLPPLVHVVQHFECVSSLASTRGPMQRRFASGIPAAYDPCVFEIPVWGRKLVTIMASRATAGAVTGFKVAGVQYRTEENFDQLDAISYSTSDQGTHFAIEEDLVIDASTGATELTTDFDTRSLTIENECFHTLRVYMKSAAGPEFRFVARGQD